MAATMQLWRRITRRLVMNGGNRGGGQFLGVHDIHRRLFSSRGSTHGGIEAPRLFSSSDSTHGGIEAPNNYNQDYNYKRRDHYNYCYKPPHHYNEDLHYNNPSDGYSSSDKYFNNISEKRGPIKMMEYDFEKLEYRIFSMEHDLEKHYEKLHRALQESGDEIRDEREKAALSIHTEKLSNELKTTIHYNMNKLTNDLINVCAKHVAESKAAMDDPTIVCAERVAKSKAAVAESKAAMNDGDLTS